MAFFFVPAKGNWQTGYTNLHKIYTKKTPNGSPVPTSAHNLIQNPSNGVISI